MKKICLLFLIILAVPIISLNASNAPSANAEKAVYASGKIFSLLETAFQINPQKNVLLSPLSLQQCFGMISCGASPAAAAELQDTLGISPAEAEKVQNFLQNTDDSSVKFNSYNTLLFNHKLTLQNSFIEQAIKLYRAKLYKVDFSRTSECVDILNGLIRQQTNNMFDKVFNSEDLAGDPALALLNVLYFKARWAVPFEKHQTAQHPFKLPEGTLKNVDMMSAKWFLPYYDDGNIRAVTLQYEDARFKLMLLMPSSPEQPLTGVIKELTGSGFKKFLDQSSREHRTHLQLPRVKLYSDCDLVKILEQTGVRQIFDPRANALDKLVQNSPLYIDRARQLIKLNWDEYGTEMSAVTYAIAMRSALMPQNEKFNIFCADRPFVLILFDTQSDSVLAAGIVNDPQE